MLELLLAARTPPIAPPTATAAAPIAATTVRRLILDPPFWVHALCASALSYLVLTENPFPCIQMTVPELSRAVTGGVELAASMTLLAEGVNPEQRTSGVREP
jgi:hypothetical protein